MKNLVCFGNQLESTSHSFHRGPFNKVSEKQAETSISTTLRCSASLKALHGNGEGKEYLK